MRDEYFIFLHFTPNNIAFAFFSLAPQHRRLKAVFLLGRTPISVKLLLGVYKKMELMRGSVTLCSERHGESSVIATPCADGLSLSR